MCEIIDSKVLRENRDNPTVCDVHLSVFQTDPTPMEVACMFAGMSDDDQAACLGFVGQIGKSWEEDWENASPADRGRKMPVSAEWQWNEVGKHLAECSPEGPGAEVIGQILEGYQKNVAMETEAKRLSDSVKSDRDPFWDHDVGCQHYDNRKCTCSQHKGEGREDQ